MTSNSKKWEDFLAPLTSKKHIRRPQDSDDNKTIEPKPCMSRDLAISLSQKVSVDKKELDSYKRREPIENTEKRKHTNERGVSFEDADVKANKFISSMSPDLKQEFEDIESIEEQEPRTFTETNLLQKGEKNESLSPNSKPVQRQMKTEAVDESEVGGDNDDVSSNESISSVSSEVEQKESIEEEKENVEQDDLWTCKKTNFHRDDKQPKLEAAEKNMEENSTECLSSNSDTEDETRFPGKNTFPQRVSSDMKQQVLDTPKPTMEEISSSELPAGFSGKIISDSPKDRPGIRQTKKTDGRSTSLSKWTFKMFVDHIYFDKCVRELCLPFENSLVEELEIDVLYDDVLGMFGANSLKNCMMKENESRVLLDGILMKLSKKYKFLVQMEVKSKLQYLPTGTFDYMITTKNGVPLGCVEAKSPAGMEKKSFGQAVLELNLVQQLALKKGVDVENTPLFCILSDGYRFIFMQLKGTELFLEHTIQRPLGYVKSGAHTSSKVIQIRKLDGADDFKIMISSMTGLITSSLLSAEGPVVKKKN